MDDPIFEIIEGDKRKVKRITLPKPVHTTLSLMGREIPVQLKNYSYTGLGLFVPSDHVDQGHITTVESRIVFPKHEFIGQVMYSEKRDSDLIHIGFRLPADSNSQYFFKKEDPNRDVVKDPATVKNIYDDLIYKSYECPVQIYQNQSLLTFFPLSQTSSGTIIGEIYESKQGQVGRGPCYCNFSLFQTYHMFQSEVLRISGDKVEVKMSPTVSRLLRRETLRVEKEDREHELKVRLTCKLLQQDFVNDDIFDYSEHGLSLIDYEEKFSFPKGMPIERIQIRIKGAGIVEGVGYVRNYIWNREKRAYVLGIRFDTQNEPNITNWHNFILKARYPMLDYEYYDSYHPKIWGLFERSGYIGLSESGEFTDAYDISKKTWKTLDDAGSEISKRILLVEGEEVMGHLQMDRIYPFTWGVHQLAIDPKKSKLVGREIYSVAVDVLNSIDTKYFTTITDVDKPWNKRSYYDFIEQYPFPEHNETRFYEVYEGKPFIEYKFDKIDAYRVFDANKWDLVFISKYFDKFASQIEEESSALTREHLELKELNESYKEFGMERRRTFRLLKKGDEIVGFSRIEIGPEATNVFGLMDLMYIYVVPEYQHMSDYVHDHLIAESLNFYKSLKRKNVIIYLDDHRKEHYESKGLSFIWNGVRWIAKKEILTRYYAHVRYTYGHILNKKGKRNAIKKEK
jgi:hypothetical protein